MLRRSIVPVLAVLAAASLAAGSAAAAPPPGAVALGPTAYGNVKPAVVVDVSGAITAAFVRQSGAPASYEVHVAHRGAAPGPFADQKIAFAPGTVVDSLQLVRDPVGRRLVLFAGTSAIGTGRVGAWDSVSADGGATWSAPVKIWDEFFAADSFAVRPTDGSFGMVPGQTGVARLMIPPALPFQQSASFFAAPGSSVYNLTLSDAIISRLSIDQAFGPDGRSYTMFEAGAPGGFVHVGGTASANDRADFGPALDRRVTSTNDDLDIAGGPKGAGILGSAYFTDAPLTFSALSAAGPGTPVVVPNAPSTTRAIFPKLITAPDGTFYAIWLAAGPAGAPMVTRASSDGGATWGPLHTVVSATDRSANHGIDSGSTWSVGGPANDVGALAWFDDATQQAYVLPFDAKAVDGGGPAAVSAFTSPKRLTLAAVKKKGVAIRITAGAATTATLRVLRGKTVVVIRTLKLKAGPNSIVVRIPKPKKGVYTLRLSGTGIARTATTTVR